ncbi:DEAD/DEAH box helicase [Streptomyces sp. NPDC048172]|uniref:DEAD/DEAH box helicase n=1 Tax=Streptomyces sp. NPDC048172 TaxID=3365505 RepID=UPI003719D859
MAETVSSPDPTSQLTHCAAVLLTADPPRLSRLAFWRPDGSPPVAPGPSGPPPTGTAEDLSVALPDEDGTVGMYTVPALLLTMDEALPVLTRARAARTGTAAEFWGAAALLALRLTAQGKLLPGLTSEDHDAWRLGPLGPGDTEALAELAAAMPPYAHAVPLSSPADGEPLRLPSPQGQLRAFVDAVADTMPRTPAAPLALGGSAFTDPGAVRALPELRRWAQGVAAGHDAGVRLSLRIEVDGLTGGSGETEGGGDTAPRFRGVLQVHSLTDATVVADAAEVWTGSSSVSDRFGPRARTDALLTLRRAAGIWEALSPLLSAAVPDALELADEEIAELLGSSVASALAAAGVEVHWPRELAMNLTARAVITPGDSEDGEQGHRGSGGFGSGPPSFLSPEALLSFNWRFAVGDHEVSRAELEQLAEAGRPVVRLRDQWVLVDPEAVRKANKRQDHKVGMLDALGSVLTGTSEQDGKHVDVQATGWLEELRARLADPEGEDRTPPTQPAALQATLRDYQLRGLGWLHRMTSLGLGACLADDMGLGKTITLIALHLQRQERPETAGPTLVICPTSLMGNWQREIERFAPGTPVRRYHGPSRSLETLADGEFVLTTYGTMRLDAERLGAPSPGAPWGMVVADEAQHVKNSLSATAKALRTIPAQARVALTGTPVENNLSELWSILDWTTPSLLGRLGTFRRRYADAAEGGTDPAATERLARLVRPFLLRRHKTDPGIAPELPPKTETDRAVSLTAEQAGLYEAVVRESLAELSGTEGFTRRGLVVRLLTSLKQICNHPAQYLKEQDRPRLPGRSGKLELLDELLDTILAEDASVLVFTQYVQMARLLERHLATRGVPTQCLHGGTPVAEREDMVRRFQEGSVPVFLLSLKAAGTGLNLTRAEHVIHFDRWWNPAVEAQATDRAYRIGQTRPVQVHRLITEGTIEDRIAEMLRRKQALADAVLGSGEGALTELSDAELAELVELRRDER